MVRSSRSRDDSTPAPPSEPPASNEGQPGRARRSRSRAAAPRHRPLEGREQLVTEGEWTARVSFSDEPAAPGATPAGELVGPPLGTERAPIVRPVDLEEQIDADAAKVVRRLARSGFEAYLVGGCVRDLLLGKTPKDFDVATSARPDDVRRIFRNSRIIGRRFRLVHVLFGGNKVIETATFRRAPREGARPGDDLLIRNDNVFGEAYEDAERRDFTINGLFYDVERRCLLDWVGGLRDVEARAVRTIGDPTTRFLEDPVRMLRAIKFSARCDCGISPEVYDAVVACRGALAMAAKPRLFEEMLRLMRGGAAHRSMWLAWELGILDVLLPELSSHLSDCEDTVFWRLMTELDRHTAEVSAPVDDVTYWTTLLLEPMLEACAGEEDRMAAAADFLEPIIDRLNVPRRIADAVARIVSVLPRLERGQAGRFGRTPLGPLAQEVQRLSAASRGRAPSEPVVAGGPAAPVEPAAAPKKRRRRRPRSAAASPHDDG